jgi:hypothetical protein
MINNKKNPSDQTFIDDENFSSFFIIFLNIDNNNEGSQTFLKPFNNVSDWTFHNFIIFYDLNKWFELGRENQA